MKAVITVTGRDTTGIISKVSAKCAERKVNIIDISQSVLEDFFAMTMLVEIDSVKDSFSDFVDEMNDLGRNMGLDIHTMHEDIFNSMHKI